MRFCSLQNRDGQLVNILNGYIHWKGGAADVVGLIAFVSSNQIVLCKYYARVVLFIMRKLIFFSVNYIYKCYVGH